MNTHMNTHTVSTENHLAPTFFGLCWCRLNSFVLMLLSSLKSFGFNTTVSWENTKTFFVCVCAYSFTLLLLLLTLPTTYSFDISKFEYNTKLFSLFFFNEKNYIRISYMLQCAASFFFQHIFTISSVEEFLFRLLILTGERASFKQCSCYI